MQIRNYFLCCIIAFTLFGCSPVINNDADEIKLHSWKSDSAELSFDGDSAVMSLSFDNRNTIIDGLCVFDDEKFIIFDDSDKYFFYYELSGKTLSISYNGDTLDFVEN